MYRADHIGSLLRPPDVLAVIGAGADETETVDDAISDAIEMQQRLGLPVVTDGEFRRTGFLGGFIAAVDGFELGQPAVVPWKGGTGNEPPKATNTRVVTRELTAKKRMAEEEAAFMREHAALPFKITLPNSGSFALYGWQRDLSGPAYPTREDLIEGTATILESEAAASVADGAAYIQIDAPGYAIYGDPSHRERWSAEGVDLDRILDVTIAGDNRILAAARSAGATTACHVCRGNNMGRWMAEGGYDATAEQLFGTLLADRLLLEYDTANAGGFEPLRFVPKGTIAVLGLISTKTGTLEDRSDVLRRIEEAAQFISIDQLALSPQCGFASTAAGNPLTTDQQWRKLELVVSVADEVWGN
jgi:5-methyltetrahydropteroyltriglutamate--homocysteine methyltransferase